MPTETVTTDREATIDRLACKFLRWNLPETVCSDPCAMKPGPGRSGTNLMNQPEARAMVEFLLENDDGLDPREALASRLINIWCDSHGSRISWAKAIEISAVITRMSDEEKNRLLSLD